MGDKGYRPILKDGDHLVSSTKNPERVRGQSRDANNKNPDIVEWEEVDVDKLVEKEHNRNEEVHLSPIAEYIIARVVDRVVSTVFDMTEQCVREYVIPKVRYLLWPWIRDKGRNAISSIKSRKRQQEKKTVQQTMMMEQFVGSEVSAELDQVFEPLYIDMEPEEAEKHIMQLLYHMLGVANEIRILSDARIKKECEDSALQIERNRASEKLIAEKVAQNIDRLLSSPGLNFDVMTSREIFGLVGGGVTLNGEYVPVEVSKVTDAMKKLNYTNE